MRTLFLILGVIGALATVAITSNADALPVSPVPHLRSDVTLIAGGCGIGFHRGPYGGCLPNGVGYPAVGYGGVYRGGAYRGGAYRGGVYRGGGYHRGGVYRR